MTDQEIESLRRKVDRQVVCMGMGDEERFVNGSEIVLRRDTVTLLLDEIERLHSVEAMSPNSLIRIL